jgi:hypothetical protein
MAIRLRGSPGRDNMVAGFTTTYDIGAYHYRCCEFEYHSWRGAHHYFYGRHHKVVDRYEISISQMTMNILLFT